MDPLHPLLPIQPAPLVPPDYTRVQRIQRDQQRESEPDWQHSPDDEADDRQRQEQFEDDYDPNWSEPAATDTYNDHGELTDAAGLSEPAPAAPKPGNPRLQQERRSRPRSSADPEDQDPDGPHIDIVA